MKAALAVTLIALGLSAAPASPPVFTDVTAASGIKFRHVNGAFGKKFLPETLGSGCAFLDYDNDGWQDILLINSTHFPSQAGAAGYPALYHNNKNGTFTDVTREAGLAVEMYGMGVAAADYDNDGNVDIYVTALGQNHLFKNQGGGKFKDVSAAAGVAHDGFSTSAMWLDYDRDGQLDLFVTDYVQWTAANDLFCSLDGKSKSYCTPESYKGRSPTLYHNRGNGTFEDVTKKAGLLDPASKALGIALIDVDDDGWPDIFVANDTQPNRLYRNRRDGTFQDLGMTAGVAFNEAGVARAGMGVDAADIDGSGRQTLVIGNFSNEMMSLYVNDGKGLFIDEAPSSGIGRASLLTLTFACFFFDYDLDGMLDIFAANGHVADDINTVQPKITYAEPAHLFRNAGKRRFEEVTARSGAALQQRVVARGAAYADIDNDGDLDLLVSANNGPARLLRNDGGNRSKMLRMKMVGASSNRDAIGTKVKITAADGSILRGMVKTGSSYCSQSELTLTFGLGSAAAVKAIDVTWPNGKVETLPGTDAGQTITVQEGKGIVARAPVRQTS